MRGTAVLLRRFPRAAGGLARKDNSPLPSKFGNRTWYKGNKTRKLGRFTNKGAYQVDYKRLVPQYVVPGAGDAVRAAEHDSHAVTPTLPPGCVVGADGWDQGLKPYVSAKTPKVVVPPPPMPDGWKKFSKMLEKEKEKRREGEGYGWRRR